jgi:hypothetical protein
VSVAAKRRHSNTEDEEFETETTVDSARKSNFVFVSAFGFHGCAATLSPGTGSKAEQLRIKQSFFAAVCNTDE